LFESQRRRITRFAERNRLILHDYDNCGQPEDTWAWNLYGKLWGRSYYLQISTNPQLARIEHFNVWLFVAKRDVYGPMADQDVLELEPGELAGTDGFLDESLKSIGRYAVRVIRNLPWKPAKPETV
jgi:hypothetical protein